MSPFEKMHKHAYVPICKINCHIFNFYWAAQNNKTYTVYRECNIHFCARCG